jgi:hypothetical protein
MRLTVLVPRVEPDPAVLNAVTPRVFHEVDAFAAALGAALDIDVPVIEGDLADAPSEGYVLAFDVASDVDAKLAPRIIAIAVGRAWIMELVDSGLAGAVEEQQYFQWRTHRTQGPRERALGLVGRKDVAEQIGARVMMTGPYTSERYGALIIDQPGTLITLLAVYLRAYSKAVDSL